MQIYINNKPAVIKKGSSFEYVSENRLFTDSDAYTLTITFPLKDCPQNIAIFGHINRADVEAQKLLFDCELRDRNFYKFGSITITEISETEVKAQFLEGRSEQNYDKTFDKVYINELDLGRPLLSQMSPISTRPRVAWDPSMNGNRYVALPWVKDGYDIIHNGASVVRGEDNSPIRDENGEVEFAWNDDVKNLSWQPYLLHITKKICEAIPGGGYSIDISEIEEKPEYKYLLICNSLATTIMNFAEVLPHWTVEEYFRKLELFLNGEFEIDHRNKKITFSFTKSKLDVKNDVLIADVVDEFSSEVKFEDEKGEYRGAKNLVYKECDHNVWKYYSCDWLVKQYEDQGKVVMYDTLSRLEQEVVKVNSTWYPYLDSNEDEGGDFLDKLYYASDVDAYFIMENATSGSSQTGLPFYKTRVRQINHFGGSLYKGDKEEVEREEIEFVPACLDFLEDEFHYGLFLKYSSGDDSSAGTDEGSDTGSDAFNVRQSEITKALKAGEKTKSSAVYDLIYIGWYDGTNFDTTSPYDHQHEYLPHPNVFNIEQNWLSNGFHQYNFSLRLNDRTSERYNSLHKINPKVKTTFKFISDSIPDVRAVFLIKGKRYLCGKLTATFSETGMSQLIKGEFYPITE